MNIIKFAGRTIQTFDNLIQNGAGMINDVLVMGRTMTINMVAEQKEETKQSLKSLKKLQNKD